MNREFELINEIYCYAMEHNLKADEKFYGWLKELREIMEVRRWSKPIDDAPPTISVSLTKEQEEIIDRINEQKNVQKNIKSDDEIKILSGMVTAYRDAIRILKDKE